MKNNNNISSSANSAIRNNNAILNEGEYIVWTFGDNGDPYNTKKEALAARKKLFGNLYSSEAEMDRLIPVRKEIWTSNVPVCTYEERLKDIENQSENSSAILEKIISYNSYSYDLKTNDLLGVRYDDLLAEISKIQNGWRTLNNAIVKNTIQIGDTCLNISLAYIVKTTREIKGNQAFVTETYSYTVTVYGDKKSAAREINHIDRHESYVVNAITDAVFETLGLDGVKRSLDVINCYGASVKEWLGGTSTSAISRKMNKCQYGVIAKGAYTLPGGVVCQTELEYNMEQDANGFWGRILRVKCVCGQYTAYDNVDTKSELLSFTDYIDIAISKAAKNAVHQYVNAIISTATAA